eukprot:m.121068 g.121068  ORF g.121068 m.121068 type:complete len:547 (+) comp19609_c1_seq1:721-2361(+)
MWTMASKSEGRRRRWRRRCRASQWPLATGQSAPFAALLAGGSAAGASRCSRLRYQNSSNATCGSAARSRDATCACSSPQTECPFTARMRSPGCTAGCSAGCTHCRRSPLPTSPSNSTPSLPLALAASRSTIRTSDGSRTTEASCSTNGSRKAKACSACWSSSLVIDTGPQSIVSMLRATRVFRLARSLWPAVPLAPAARTPTPLPCFFLCTHSQRKTAAPLQTVTETAALVAKAQNFEETANVLQQIAALLAGHKAPPSGSTPVTPQQVSQAAVRIQTGTEDLQLDPQRRQQLVEQLYRLAADRKDPTAMFNLAALLLSQRKEEDLAVDYLTVLADGGHGLSMLHLGQCYEIGRGAPKDSKTALELYLRAAQAGVADGWNAAGLVYRGGDGNVQQDFVKALELFQKGVEHGSASAHISLAHMYSNGKGTKQNWDLAFEHNIKAAEMGSAMGIFNVGTCYFAGKGCVQDYKKALEHFVAAAEAGFAYAQVNAGNMYMQGLGCDTQPEMAARFYTMAKNQGHAYAADLLQTAQEKAEELRRQRDNKQP